MSAVDRPNLRRWAGVGWGTKEAEKLLCKEGFELAVKTGYGRTVSNIQGKGIPDDRSSYRKTARLKTYCESELQLRFFTFTVYQ